VDSEEPNRKGIENVGLLDGDAEEPKSKLRRYVVSGMAFGLLVWLAVWWVLRFHTEKQTVENFFEALLAGETQLAYQIWKPQPTYTYEYFVADWGPQGLYGPVASYRIETAEQPEKGSGVVVVVSVSPVKPFPSEKDEANLAKVKEVKLWVERKDQSLSFAP
jgi:hypothetical protein